MADGQRRLGFLGLVVAHAAVLVHASSAGGQETLIGVVGKDFIVLGADSSVSQSIGWTSTNLDKIAILDNCSPTPVAAAVIGDAADSDRLVGMLTANCAIREWETSHGSDVEYMTKPTDPNDNSNHHSVPWTISTLPSTGLSTDAVAHMARSHISHNLRTRKRMNVCLLVAGMSENNLPDLSSNQRLQNQLKHSSQPITDSDMTTTTSEGEKSNRYRPQLFWIDPYGSLQRLPYGAHGFASNFCLSILDQGYRPGMSRHEAIELVRSCFDQLRVRYVISAPQPPCIKCFDASSPNGGGWSLIR